MACRCWSRSACSARAMASSVQPSRCCRPTAGQLVGSTGVGHVDSRAASHVPRGHPRQQARHGLPGARHHGPATR
jgi:hypothetical protein